MRTWILNLIVCLNPLINKLNLPPPPPKGETYTWCLNWTFEPEPVPELLNLYACLNLQINKQIPHLDSIFHKILKNYEDFLLAH